MNNIVPQRGILLLNLGTPDSATPTKIRTYLRQFLSDPRVLDIPWLARFFILNFFILPFRPRKAAAAYQKIWTERGSPLAFYTKDLAAAVQHEVGPSVKVLHAMRYQNPSIHSALKEFQRISVENICVVPLFPQYSSAAWGSAVEEVYRFYKDEWNIPAISVVPPFYNHPDFIRCFVNRVRDTMSAHAWDKIIFSFHGLPERHCRKSDLSGTHCFASNQCCDRLSTANRYCYRAQSFETARCMAQELGLRSDQWQVTFQSRLGRTPWIKPYTDHLIDDYAKSGVKKLIIASPSFVADCLETLEEISIRAREQFVGAGGQELTLVPSLNAEKDWAQALVRLVAAASPAC